MDPLSRRPSCCRKGAHVSNGAQGRSKRAKLNQYTNGRWDTNCFYGFSWDFAKEVPPKKRRGQYVCNEPYTVANDPPQLLS
jgi:hypothetical protein